MDKIYSYILSQIPDCIDFDFITVKNETIKHIFLDNISDQNILFNIENAEGFFFEPTNGILPKKKKLDVQIKVQPNFADVLVANAKIILEQKYSKIIKISSVSKYPYLTLNKLSLEFGLVQIGHTREEELIVSNLETVPAHFTIERTSTQPGNQPCMFYISNLTGDIPPKSNFLLKILFKPIFPSMNSHEIFRLSTKGGNKIIFACKGSCKPLKTWVGTKCVNFNTVSLGSQMKKLFRIYNDSDLPTEFQIYHDNSGAFSFDNTEGIIPGKSNIRINATFKPYETMMYYQRVFCLIKNHMLFPIDLFGSCHNLLTKTPLLDMKTIEMFRNKELKGVFFSNNNNNNLLKQELFDNNFNQTITASVNSIDKANENNKNNNISSVGGGSQQPQLHKEMFWEPFSSTRLISFDVDLIDFCYVQSGTVSEPYILRVNNNSNKDMKVKFIFEKPINLSNLIKTINIFHSENTVFFTQPEEQIIPKKSSADFKVYFKPNKSEYYFFENLPCQATIIDNNNKNNNNINNNNNNIQKQFINTANMWGGTKNIRQLADINKNKLSEFGKEMLNNTKLEANKTVFSPKNSIMKSISMYSSLIDNNNNNNNIKNKTLFGQKNKIVKINNQQNQNNNNNFDPPITLYISLVGHSFPPGTQIYMPMFEFNPKREIFFPPTSINQSLYQTLKIQNKNDVPLFYKINQDPEGIFRIFSKYGLIPPHSFHLICLEFSPKDTKVYKFPLVITLNHDPDNKKTIMVNGLCTDPVIELEGVNKEMYFPPSYVGIKAKKTVSIKNLSPIKILVNINISNMTNGLISVDENCFEMDINSIKKIDFFLTPKRTDEINANVTITAERTYDPSSENIGIYNPEHCEASKKKLSFDKRIFTKEFIILGRGSDGDISIKPDKLEFGTVKVGFHKKLSFSIYNPTITNFYIKIIPDYSGNLALASDKNLANFTKQRSDITFDITEGLLNSFCQKDINIQFEPKTRVNLAFKVNIYATDNKNISYIKKSEENINNNNKNNININNNNKKNEEEEKNHNQSSISADEVDDLLADNQQLKCSLEITAKGDYPLIKIVDLRNNIISPSKLWKDFNVDLANEELQKKLTDEEMNYSNAKTNKKIDDVTQKLKLIRFNFGKNFLSKSKPDIHNQDVFLTLKNEGGVLSEFFFKFPEDITIKREIWMDPVEPTSNDKVEYHVIKERIFTVEPRKSKLGPGETCNIRLRYTIKERGVHRLRVLFQVVNGKPLIFELYGETLNDKNGVIALQKDCFEFDQMPIGYTGYLTSPIEIRNISSVKIRYWIDKKEIKKFNDLHSGFEIFKIDNIDGSIGPGETKYIIASFRPLNTIEYKMKLNLNYTDEINTGLKKITICGKGYHPLKEIPRISNNSYGNMPNFVVCNHFNNQMIQKCGFNIEELDFGCINKPKNKTFILYNYSKDFSFNFDFNETNFIIKDQLIIMPNKDTIEPNSHKVIKCILIPDENINSNYEGDILVKISWNNKPNPLNGNIIPGSLNVVKSPNKFYNSSNNFNPMGSFNNKLMSNTTNIPLASLMNTPMNSGGANKTEKENIYLRMSKKTKLSDNQKEFNEKLNLNSNYSFVELIIMKLTKDILTSKDFSELFHKNVDYQPLNLYQWTSNDICSSLKDVRQRYLKNLDRTVIDQYGDLSQIQAGNYKRSGIRSEVRTLTHRGFTIKDQEIDLDLIQQKIDKDLDNKLEEKYSMELLNKYKYSIKEMNEKILIVNEETKKLICDIVMENTIYNILSEAIYGEIDLTEKQRIYFFIDKNEKNEMNNTTNIFNNNSALKIGKIGEENKNEKNSIIKINDDNDNIIGEKEEQL